MGYLAFFCLFIAKLTLSLSLDCGIRNHYRWHLGYWFATKTTNFYSKHTNRHNECPRCFAWVVLMCL